MEEQTANLTVLMEKLLTRYDEEKVVADRRAEEQTAFNTQVSHELQSLSKQIGLTQADVDDVHKVTSPSASSAPSTGSQIDDLVAAGLQTPAAHKGQQHTRMALPTPPPEVRAAPPPSALPIPQAITGQPRSLG